MRELVKDKIICGDCLEVMREMADESVDAVLTSPPYNLRNSSGRGITHPVRRETRDKLIKLVDGYDSYSDDMPRDLYVEWQRACLKEMLRIIKPAGAIFYNNKRRVQSGLLMSPEDITRGFPLRQIIIWDRCGGLNYNRGYFIPGYEEIYLIAKSEFKLSRDWVGFSDVWRIAPDTFNPHPAPFPLKLAERVIISLSETHHKKVVLDPFCGSGTTCVAAKRYNCAYIGIDISAAYCAMAEERLSKENSIEQYLI